MRTPPRVNGTRLRDDYNGVGQFMVCVAELVVGAAHLCQLGVKSRRSDPGTTTSGLALMSGHAETVAVGPFGAISGCDELHRLCTANEPQ